MLSSFPPTMYLNFSVGEKQTHITPHHPITYQRLYNPSVGHMIDWLLPASRDSRPCPLTHTNAVGIRIPNLGNYRCHNQFIIPFTHRVGGLGGNIISAWILLIRRVLALPNAAHVILLFLHVVFTWQINSLDRKPSVLFPQNIKQSPTLG